MLEHQPLYEVLSYQPVGDSKLKDRFMLTKTIKGTLGFHSFTPIAGSRSHLIVKRYDLATEAKCVKVVI